MVISPIALFLVPRPAYAFDAGNLIADAEFINWRTLDATGVQQFLNSKGGTRLRTFSEGGRSAAQIIADAARSNGINPFVILATIQKEESLVDSNTNFDFRINWAMGYSICDSCSLDDSRVQANKGFTKQIDNGTWQLKRNYSYHAANGSAWNVGKTMIIDGQAVRFANRATSSLYRYTPHLHGNENFYNIYNRYKSFSGSKWDTGKIAKTKAVDKTTLVAEKLRNALKTTKPKGTQPSDITNYAAQYVNQVGGSNLRSGQKLTIYVYLRNTGATTWVKSGANPVYLGNSSSRDRNSIFTGGNIRWQMLNASVAPDRIGVFSIQITAPQQPGTYVEKFQPVVEGITWFGEEISFTFDISVSGNAKIK